MIAITLKVHVIRRLVFAARSMTSIGTHDGTFHCDEVLGCWMLKRTERFAKAEITRTRDPKILEKMDVLVDVGNVYDPGMAAISAITRFRGRAIAEMSRFDHHQKGFNEIFGHGGCSN